MPLLSKEERSIINRRNAAKSTGPRTARGKAIAAGNALRHGIFAQRLLLPGEDAAELTRLKCGLVRSLKPRNAMEMELVERILSISWKLRRLQRAERAQHVYENDEWNQEDWDREEHGLGAGQPIPPEVVWNTAGSDQRELLEHLEAKEYRLQNSLNRTLREYTALRKAEIEDELPELAADVIHEEEQALALREGEAMDKKEDSSASVAPAPNREATATDVPSVAESESMPAAAPAATPASAAPSRAVANATTVSVEPQSVVRGSASITKRNRVREPVIAASNSSNDEIQSFLTDASISAETRTLVRQLQQACLSPDVTADTSGLSLEALLRRRC